MNGKPKKSGWSFFIDNNEIGDIDQEFLKYKVNLEKKEQTEAYLSICEIERLINNVVDKQRVHIATVF